jgi:hypothetical protein
MSITTLTSASQQTRSIERQRPLLSVMAWELRRFGASRLFWLQALGFFCLSLFLQYAGNFPPNQVQSVAQLQQLLLSVENRLPNLAGWFASHLLLAGFSLVLVLIAALAFKRSRAVLN